MGSGKIIVNLWAGYSFCLHRLLLAFCTLLFLSQEADLYRLHYSKSLVFWLLAGFSHCEGAVGSFRREIGIFILLASTAFRSRQTGLLTLDPTLKEGVETCFVVPSSKFSKFSSSTWDQLGPAMLEKQDTPSLHVVLCDFVSPETSVS